MPGTFLAPPPKPRKSVLSTRLPELALSLADLLHITFIALDHVNEIGRGTGDVVTDVSFVGGEEGVRRGSYCSKRTRLAPTSITAESSRCFGGWSAVFGSN